MKKILVFAIAALCCIGLFAESDGAKGFKFLTISTTAEEAAQGGTGSFSSSNALVFLNNPAASLFDRSLAVSINQNYWISDTMMNNFGIRNSREKVAYGFGFRYLDYKDIEGRDEIGTPTGDFSPMDFAFTANTAFRLNPDHYIGINASVIYEKIDTASSYGYAIDLGYTYLTPIQDLTFAVAVKNLGSASKMDVDEMELPISFEISAIKKLQRFSSEFKLLKINDDDSFKGALGGNYSLTKNLNLRAGYKFGYDTEDFSAGFGIKIKRINLDYAYVAFSEELDDIHMVGLNYTF